MAKKLYANGVTGDVCICESDADIEHPLNNINKIYFHSALDYLRIETILNVTINLPERKQKNDWDAPSGREYEGNTWGFVNYQLYYHGLGYRPLFVGYFTSPTELVKIPFCGEFVIQTRYEDSDYGGVNYFRTILLGTDNNYLYFQEMYSLINSYDNQWKSLSAISVGARIFLMSEV